MKTPNLSAEAWEEEFREKFIKKSDPSGYGIMSMWKSAEDPEDAINFIKKIRKEAYNAGRAEEAVGCEKHQKEAFEAGKEKAIEYLKKNGEEVMTNHL